MLDRASGFCPFLVEEEEGRAFGTPFLLPLWGLGACLLLATLSLGEEPVSRRFPLAFLALSVGVTTVSGLISSDRCLSFLDNSLITAPLTFRGISWTGECLDSSTLVVFSLLSSSSRLISSVTGCFSLLLNSFLKLFRLDRRRVFDFALFAACDSRPTAAAGTDIKVFFPTEFRPNCMVCMVPVLERHKRMWFL